MLLDLSVVLSLALSCAPGVAPAQLAAIAKTESGLETLAIHDNRTGHSYQPKDKNDALALARHLLEAGHSVDLGIMQVNSANLKWLGLSLDDAFEPCPSIKAGASVLTAISRYNTGDSRAGFSNGYVRRVLAAGAEIKGNTAQAAAVKSETSAGEQPSHDWDVFPDETPEQAPQPPAEQSQPISSVEQDGVRVSVIPDEESRSK